jgi:SpoVK/Ycf46/Vps4 family AAA+-type ATPase
MSVSASSLTSKWIGESEALIRYLFLYAKQNQPCVIFFDEVDSLLEKRSDSGGGGNETYTRIKTEFLCQLDGVASFKKDDHVLLVCATNRPYALDEAILRRFSQRILISLPNEEARLQIFHHLLKKQEHSVTDDQIYKLARKCVNYSAADISMLCKEAAMLRIRSIDFESMLQVKKEDVSSLIYSYYLINKSKFHLSSRRFQCWALST